MKLRILIADDEPLCRERLHQFLRAESGVEIVAECTSGTETVDAIRRTSPDLVFLDVKMPELDGFGVLDALRNDRLPAIIFTTAFDRYALQAFESYAVDYLLKPFDRPRFQAALGRARKRLGCSSKTPDLGLLSELLEAIDQRAGRVSRFTVKSQGRISVVNTEEIDWIGSADNYVELHVGKKSHLLRMSLGALAEQLPQNRFLRISRFVLVNLSRIREIESKSHGDCLVILDDGTRLSASRGFRQNLEFLLKDP